VNLVAHADAEVVGLVVEDDGSVVVGATLAS